MDLFDSLLACNAIKMEHFHKLIVRQSRFHCHFMNSHC